jgi:SAM-dependent methyltransferase
MNNGDCPWLRRGEIHPAALTGFGTEAKAYARGRPDYPDELLSWLRGGLQLARGKTAVDLGAGTGKFTKLLVKTGAEVIAVEPVDAMRDQLSAGVPDIRAIPGTAEAIALEDSSVDAVVCAQAFHWFASEGALAEIHRVLRPGGKLGLVWNVRDKSVDWVAAITDIITPYEGDAPRYYTGDWRRPFDGGLFSKLEETCFEYQHCGSPQQVILDRFLSVSFIAALPEEEKYTVRQKLRDLMAHHPKLKGRDSIAFPYRTHGYYCTRE